MTLAGTRPPTVDEWEKYELHHRARLATKPGLKEMIKENLLNIALLFPFGLVLPFAFYKRLSWWKGLVIVKDFIMQKN